ncbi:sensor histidine kinase [Actinomarinicola tropica]|uniref:Sensor-like histidine kinase SenX3 n=1 Tax=Actinomarinicola tropica TaxID=2789776 RepID=A0A5Q2RJF3_9ACTN|nr:ATP-binding protein [Actinomarinicola tropica]QGG93970.1 PAS domain-containing protein [Actinomarinicola tropica]
MTDLLVGALAGALVTALVATALHRSAARRADQQRAALVDELEAAARAEQRMARALDAIPQGVAICDADGEILFHNASGSAYSSARHGDALVEAAIDDLLRRAVAGEGSVETIELFGPPKRTLVITAVPLEDGVAGRGAIAVIDDVTERRRLEAVRRDFVANISHELKTPVGALALLAETIMDERDPDVVERLAGRMLTEAHRVGRTIQDLLELSSIEVEEDKVREPVPVRQVLAGAVGRIRPAADQRQIRVELLEPDDDLAVVCDRRQLVSAVFNLLENAVKYSEAGSTVRTWAEADGDVVDIVVEDHGMGIPTRDLERVFERFYRVDQARSRRTGGTGLGLAIVRHVVNNHAGEVLVASREGEGSTFTLRFPVGAADPTALERTT